MSAPAAAAQLTRTFTFRKSGKAHPGVEFYRDPSAKPFTGFLVASCSCPGSQNGRLIQGANIVCEGHDAANCGN